MTEIEIIKEKVTNAAKLKLAANPKLYSGKVAESAKIPEYYDGYTDKIKDYRQVFIHAEPGVFPAELFANRSPNQEQKEADYIRANYQQKTLDVFIDFCNTIGRIFYDSNWSIEYQKEDDAIVKLGLTYQNYIENEIGEWGSLETYVKELMLTIKLRDAEGMVVVRPKEMPMIESEHGVLIDNSKLLEPYPYYISVENVIGEEFGKWALVEDTEKSYVDFGGKKEKAGLIYWYYDRMSIWKITQFGKPSDYIFNIELYWQHDLDYLFAFKLKGVPIFKNKKLVWQSPFLYCCAYLNSAALDESNILASKASCVYPYRVQLGNLCDFRYTDGQGEITACNSGQVFDSVSATYIDCPSCKGAGVKSRISPLGVMLLKPKDPLNDGDSTFSGEPLKYVSPETTTLEFLRTEIQASMYAARRIMHLNDSTTLVQGSNNMTATSSFMDMKSMYAFIKPISDQIFALYENIAYSIGVQRYGENFKRAAFSYPITFDFQSETDYINQIKGLKEAGAPPFMIQAVLVKYLKALFSNDITSSQAYELIVNTDRLMVMSGEEISFGLGKGTILLWEIVLHDSAFSFVNELFMAYQLANPNGEKTFFNQEYELQKEQLIALAKAKALEAKPATDPKDLISDLLNA